MSHYILKTVLVLSLLFFTSFGRDKSGFGTVTVYDSTQKRHVPVVGVEIELRSSAGRRVTYTDTAGAFSFSSVGSGSYRLNWKQKDSRFFITEDGKTPAFIKGSSSTQPWNLRISKPKDHYHATIFRAGSAYINSNFIDESNLFSNLVINANFRKKKGGGPGTARFNALTKEVTTWGMNKYGKPYSDIRLFGYIVHELGHVHHDHIFQGRSQHLDTEPRLRESWAEAVKYYLVLEEYGKSSSLVKTYSKQFPFYSGWQNNDWGKRKKYYSVYTPLVIDLVDTLNQKEVDDRVSGYTMKQILAVLKDKSCEDFDDLERLLKQRYNNPTEQYLGILFDEMEEH